MSEGSSGPAPAQLSDGWEAADDSAEAAGRQLSWPSDLAAQVGGGSGSSHHPALLSGDVARGGARPGQHGADADLAWQRAQLDDQELPPHVWGGAPGWPPPPADGSECQWDAATETSELRAGGETWGEEGAGQETENK